VTDEQLGRKWCERQSAECVPHKVCPGKWLWYQPEVNGYEHFEPWLVVSLDHDFYSTESEAYAAVGAALRELKRRADEIAVVLDSLAGRWGDD
jgi:hypothetical protein